MEFKDVVLIGVNPAVLLRTPAGPTAYASLWFVDWSPCGTGRVLVLVHGGRMRVLGPRPELGSWLVHTLVRYFGEVAELEWSEPELENTEVEAVLDLENGLEASAGDVRMEISRISERRPFRQDRLTFGEDVYELVNVVMPCERAWVEVAGRRVEGEPSPAFIAVAEVWTTVA